MYVCLSARPVCLSVCPSVRQSVGLSVCRSVGLSVCRSVCRSVCLSFCPSVCVNVLFHCPNAWPALLIPTRAQQHPNGGNGCGIATQVAHTSRHDRQGIDDHEEVQVVPVNANCRPPSHSQETIKSSKIYQIESGDSKSIRWKFWCDTILQWKCLKLQQLWFSYIYPLTIYHSYGKWSIYRWFSQL